MSTRIILDVVTLVQPKLNYVRYVTGHLVCEILPLAFSCFLQQCLLHRVSFSGFKGHILGSIALVSQSKSNVVYINIQWNS